MLGVIVACFFVITGAGVNPYAGLGQEEISELKEVKESKLIQNEYDGRYTKEMTSAELEELLNKVLKAYNGSSFKDKNSNSKSITRSSAAIMLFKAAKSVGPDFPNGTYINKSGKEARIHDILEDMQICGDYMPVVDMNGEEWYNQTVQALNFVICQSDKISGNKILPPINDEFYPFKKITNKDGILAAFRLLRSLSKAAKYVVLDEVGTHTIPKELYTDTTILPPASNRSLPVWRGMNTAHRAFAHYGAWGYKPDNEYRESDMKLIHDMNMNFTRTMISFSYFGYPKYPKDNRINLTMLEELDQWIAWGMKYGVHVQLCMSGFPEMIHAEWPQEIETGDFFSNTKKQALTAKYWRMLAKRYADIPNEFLSFNLVNEIDPPDDLAYAKVMKPIIDGIRGESSDRVIVADVHSHNITGEAIAQLGVALSAHIYKPEILNYIHDQDIRNMFEAYPDYLEEQRWPMLYLPSILWSKHNENEELAGKPLVFEGDFSEGEIKIYVLDVMEDKERIEIKIDSETVLDEQILIPNKRNRFYRYTVKKEYTVKIPRGSRRIEIAQSLDSEGWGIQIGRIEITQQNQKPLILYPQDVYGIEFDAPPPTVHIGENNSLQGNKFLDWEYIFKWSKAKDTMDLAERYNVGFMIGEFGPFDCTGKQVPLPDQVFYPYTEIFIKGMNALGIGWAHGQYTGLHHIVATNKILKTVTYRKLPNSPYYVDTKLEAIFKNSVKNK